MDRIKQKLIIASGVTGISMMVFDMGFWSIFSTFTLTLLTS